MSRLEVGLLSALGGWSVVFGRDERFAASFRVDESVGVASVRGRTRGGWLGDCWSPRKSCLVQPAAADPHRDSVSTYRLPRRVYGYGSEHDPRFSLAYERTFLAWIRTGLALTAGGVALVAVTLQLQPGLKLASSLILLVMAWH